MASEAGDGERKLDLNEVLAVATEAAKQAAAIIKASFGKKGDFDVKSKKGVDMVTSVDHASEETILKLLKAKYPDHTYIAEESSAREPLTSEPTWLVDPLDGTTNFVHGYQFCCVSIGFAVNRELSVGVVLIPALDELYTAVRGGGAFLNGEPIRATQGVPLTSAMLVNNVGAGREKPFIDVSMECVREVFMAKCHAVRMTGSAAVNMVHSACGRVDAYWELLVGGPWDLAAGTVIVREAGGVVANCDGSEFDVTRLGVLCGCPSVVEALGPLLAGAIRRTVAADPAAYRTSSDAMAAAAGANIEVPADSA